MSKKLKSILVTLICFVSLLGVSASASSDGAVFVIDMQGAITPASDDFLRTAIDKAQKENAKALVVKLNTPGGLLPSMQTMVGQILDAPIPVIIFVGPSGSEAKSAGVFITMAGHVAVMAPGTTIGAAHPVTSTGGDIQGDMREKIENSAVSLIKAISEQRGKNTEWAELAVRESVAITDREALDKNVIDYIASDIDRALAKAEGRTVTVKGNPVTLVGLDKAPRKTINMSFKQELVAILADPNIAILLALGAMLGIGLELYHPGGIIPGVFGAICLVLSLTSAQVLPINHGGIALLGLAGLFFVVELLIPSFGVWGIAGTICLVLGSIYFIDSEMVWGEGVLSVNYLSVGLFAAFVGLLILGMGYLAVKSARRQVSTGSEGLKGKIGSAEEDFLNDENLGLYVGKVFVAGELWKAVSKVEVSKGQPVKVVEMNEGLVLSVEQA